VVPTDTFCKGPVLANGATLVSVFEPQLVALPTNAPKPALQPELLPPPQATKKNESATDKTKLIEFIRKSIW
jgi:hypothetical protein